MKLFRRIRNWFVFRKNISISPRPVKIKSIKETSPGCYDIVFDTEIDLDFDKLKEIKIP